MSEQQPMVDERELHELFARRRPDPERFAAGVAERLRDSDQGRGNGATLPKAAAWLPLAPGSKIWLTLSVPVLFLASSWLALLGSAGIVRRAFRAGPDADAVARDRENPETSRVVRAIVRYVLLFALAIGIPIATLLLGWPYLFDGIIATCVASMIGLAVLVRNEARGGRADRAEVAKICIGMLEFFLPMTIMWGLLGSPSVDSGQWTLAGAAVLAIGILGLGRFAPRHAIVGLIVVVYFVAVSGFNSIRRDRVVTQAEVDRFVAEPDLGEHDLYLRQYATIVQSLRGAGREVTPSADLAARMAEEEGLAFRTPQLNYCARADLLPPSAWQRLAGVRMFDYRLDRLVVSDETTLPPHYNEYVFRMLATRSLSDAERERVVRRLTRNWPDAQSRSPLADCQLITNALDWLGQSDLADAERDRVHALLVRQQDRGGWRRGGFSELPLSDQVDSRLPVDDIAMALIARFGVPPELDVRSLHRHLTKTSQVPQRAHAHTLNSAYAAFAQLLLLNARVGELPARSLGRILIEERLLWAMIAMVLLCLYSAWLAPLHAGQPQGAMP